MEVALLGAHQRTGWSRPARVLGVCRLWLRGAGDEGVWLGEVSYLCVWWLEDGAERGVGSRSGYGVGVVGAYCLTSGSERGGERWDC